MHVNSDITSFGKNKVLKLECKERYNCDYSPLLLNRQGNSVDLISELLTRLIHNHQIANPKNLAKWYFCKYSLTANKPNYKESTKTLLTGWSSFFTKILDSRTHTTTFSRFSSILYGKDFFRIVDIILIPICKKSQLSQNTLEPLFSCYISNRIGTRNVS